MGGNGICTFVGFMAASEYGKQDGLSGGIGKGEGDMPRCLGVGSMATSLLICPYFFIATTLSQVGVYVNNYKKYKIK